jgi:hypothetical protein
LEDVIPAVKEQLDRIRRASAPRATALIAPVAVDA